MYRLFLIALYIPMLSFGITLKEAEKSALENSHKIKYFESKNQFFNLKMSQLTTSLAPKLNLKYSKGRQITPEKNNINNSIIEFRENFTNPFSFLAQKEQLSIQQEMISLEKNHERFKIHHELRLAYFRVKLLEEQILKSNQHLEAIKKIAAISERKYTQGQIQILDKDRSLIEKSRQNQVIDSLHEAYCGQMEVLSILTGHKYSTNKLSTSLPEKFDLSFLPHAFEHTFLAKKSAIEAKKNDIDLSSERSKYLPHLYLTYQRSYFDGIKTDEHCQIGLIWDLPPEAYLASKAIDMKIISASFNHQEAQKRAQINYTELKVKLKSLLKKISAQKKITAAHKKIAKETLKQYHRGLISLKGHYEDFRLLIGEENILLQQRFEAIQLLAQLSLLMEDDSIFYKGIKL